MRGNRGMALIQALVIVAAIAAISAALLLRADQARQRLEVRFRADQAALYLDGGLAQVQAMIEALPQDPVHRRQDWARARDGIEIDRGVLAWRVDDLQGRFNLNAMIGADPEQEAARAAFLRLAQDQGLNRRAAQRLVAALSVEDPEQAEIPLPLVWPRQLAPLIPDDADDYEALLPFLAALPADAPMNINTLLPEVLEAWLPGVPTAQRSAIGSRLRRDPLQSIEELQVFAQEVLGPELAAVFLALPLATGSTLFLIELEARLDSLRLRRSVVLNRDAAQGRSAVVLSIPGLD